MDDLNQMDYETFEEFMIEAIDSLNPIYRDVVKDMIRDNKQKAMLPTARKRTRNPLPYALSELIDYNDTSSWDESIKAEIVSYFSVVEKHFKDEDGTHLVPFIRQIAFKVVCEYEEHLTEFDVDQQEQLIKAFNAVHNHLILARRHS